MTTSQRPERKPGRVQVEMRKAYTIEIGGKRRRFWTEAAAYYKLAASLLGTRYLGPLRAVESDPFIRNTNVELAAEQLDMTVPQVLVRAGRARAMFYLVEADTDTNCFDTRRWQAYVRRVAKKMRAMDRGQP